MTNIQKIISDYIDNSYVFVDWLDKKHNVQLVKSRIDNGIYVCKFKNQYNIEIYNKLMAENIENIPHIFELMETESGLIVIEDYIEGTRLDQIELSTVYNNKNIEETICEISIKICRILNKLHQMNPPVIHRDIKPQNIIISNGDPYLIDFNIAKEFSGSKTKDTFIMGTRDYAAPEQYGFSESDARTDIYGLGATIRFLINKENLDSPKLTAVVKKATEIDSDNRYQNADEMINALKYLYQEEKTNLLKKYALPGFRRGNIFFIIISSLFYLLWGYICFTFEMSPNQYTGFSAFMYNWMGRIFLILISLFTISLCSNYLGIQDRLLKRLNIYNPGIIKRFLIVILALFLIFSILFSLWVLISFVYFKLV